MRRFLLASMLVLALAFPASTHAAIAFDSVLNNTLSSGTNSFSFTNTAGDLLTYGCNTNGDGADISAVTYGGDSLSLLTHQTITTGVEQYLFYKIAPKTGANTLSMTTGGRSSTWACSIISYSSTKQTSFPDASNSVLSTGSPQSGTVTPATSGAWVVAFFVNIDGSYTSAGSGTTLRGTLVSASQFGDTNGAVSAATTVTANYSGSRANGTITFAIAPAAAAAPSLIQAYSYWW